MRSSTDDRDAGGIREIFDSFDSLPAKTEAILRPVGGTHYLFTHRVTISMQMTGELAATDGAKEAVSNKRWMMDLAC